MKKLLLLFGLLSWQACSAEIYSYRKECSLNRCILRDSYGRRVAEIIPGKFGEADRIRINDKYFTVREDAGRIRKTDPRR